MTICVIGAQRSSEGNRSPRSAVTNDFELSCRSWEMNLVSLQEQQVLLATVPSFQSPKKKKGNFALTLKKY